MKTVAIALAAIAAMSATSAFAATSTSESFFYSDGSGNLAGTESKGGSFADIFQFNTTKGEVDGSITITSYLINTTATFDGTPLTFVQTSARSSVATLDDYLVPAGTQTLDIMGTASTAHGGSFGGQVEFTSAAPEPYTWALMIAGVAMAGSALRLGRKRSEGLFAV